MQTSIADLVHAFQLGIVINWNLSRARLALLIGFVPNWSLLRADLALESSLVPNRLDIVALLSSHLLALFGYIVELCPVGADYLAFQCCIVPGGTLSTCRGDTLLGVWIIRLTWGTTHHAFH